MSSIHGFNIPIKHCAALAKRVTLWFPLRMVSLSSSHVQSCLASVFDLFLLSCDHYYSVG